MFFAFAVLMAGSIVSAQNTNQLVSNYISVKDALVSSDAQTAAKASADLQKNLKKEASFDQKDALLTAVNALAKEQDLDKQRVAFTDVSTTLWKIVKASGSLNQEVFYQYCPMKKAYWLSMEKEIKNPYYGSSMLKCGKVVETKN